MNEPGISKLPWGRTQVEIGRLTEEAAELKEVADRQAEEIKDLEKAMEKAREVFRELKDASKKTAS